MEEMLALFWFCFFVIFYTYIGYPFLIHLLGFLFRKDITKKDIEPTVAFIIAAYNEEKAIDNKIENTLALDYPKNKLEVIVVSDGSTDRTDEIVKRFAIDGVKLFRVDGRVGKTEARNRAVLVNKQEIIVFSDATTYYAKDAIRNLVRNFADHQVGHVSGRFDFRHNFCEHEVGQHKTIENCTDFAFASKSFWEYENFIKKAQTNFGTLTGVSGCINAFRRIHYTPLPPYIIEDLVEPLMFIMKGWRIIFENGAQAYETTNQELTQELSMRIRVIRGGMTGLLFAKQILNPFVFPVPALQLISHKILRWIMPIFALILFITNIIMVFFLNLSTLLYEGIFYSQLVFYVIAGLGFFLEKFGIKIKFLTFPMFFVVSNYASLVALFLLLTGEKTSTWDTNR
jgi:cellulose synthase/poly-beta-1,6-N-acetylglucosamine synthase-like glycosyltransferase